MNLFLVLPLVIPLAAAAISILLRNSLLLQRGLAILSMAALLGAGIVLLYQLSSSDQVMATQMGDWPAPYGITLVADLFSAIMIVVAALMGLVVVIFSIPSIDEPREAFGYYPLMHVLLMGVCGAFLTGDIFNLYVWFEVMLMASFVLIALGGEKQQLQGAIKYVTLNLLASAFFLAAVGILYGVAGTLNMADLAVKFSSGHISAGMITTFSMLFLIAFGTKAALFPLFFWLPASYHTPPPAISAIFAGLLTKVGVYALIRVFTLIFVQEQGFTHWLILVLAGLTMVTGVLGAAAQFEFRRILSFHIISQIGYMVMGLGLFGLAATPEMRILGLAASIFYIVHHIIVKTNLFLISGVVERLWGTGDLKRLGGLYQSHPALAVLFLIPAMSLAGMPPLSGFFAKLSLVKAGLAAEEYAIVATALVVGLLTLFSMTKIWAEVFWKATPDSGPLTTSRTREVILSATHKRFLMSPIIALAAITLTFAVAAEPLFVLATRAATQLADPEIYIQAVQGELL